MFLSDYADMWYTHFSRSFRRLNMLPVSRFQNLLCPGSDDGISSNKCGRWSVSSVLSINAESAEVETHLSIKFSEKKNFGGILRPKSVRRPMVIGLIDGLRANKQFDITF